MVRITAWPKGLHRLQVSPRTSPVTQVTEVAVNRPVRTPWLRPVRDAAGGPVQALLPVEIRVYDAAGRELDGAGYACATDGVCRLAVRTNLNDTPGEYRLVCRDRASGLVCEKRARLTAAASRAIISP